MEKKRVARKEWPDVAKIVVFLNAVCGAGGCFLFWHIANGPWVESRAGFLEWVRQVGPGVADHIGWGFGLVATIQFACLIAIIGGQINVGDNEEEAKMREVLNALAVFPLALIAPAMCVLVVGAAGDARLAGVLMVAAPVFLLLSVISVYVGTFEPANELVLERLSEERVKLARDRQNIFNAQRSTGLVRAGIVAWAAVTVVVVAGARVVGFFRDSLILEGAEIVLVGTLIFIAAMVVPYWVGMTIHLIAVLKWSAGFFDWLVVGLAGLMYLALGLLAVFAAWIASPAFGVLVGGTVIILGAISVESFHGARGDH